MAIVNREHRIVIEYGLDEDGDPAIHYEADEVPHVLMLGILETVKSMAVEEINETGPEDDEPGFL